MTVAQWVDVEKGKGLVTLEDFHGRNLSYPSRGVSGAGCDVLEIERTLDDLAEDTGGRHRA
jgi:hypothetical protein